MLKIISAVFLLVILSFEASAIEIPEGDGPSDPTKRAARLTIDIKDTSFSIYTQAGVNYYV